MASALARRGHEVAIYTTDRDADPEDGLIAGSVLRENGVSIHIFPQGRPRTLATSWPLAGALDGAVRAADVVHVHSLFLFHVWAAAWWCRRYRKPYLLRPHGTLDPLIRARHRVQKRVLGWLFQDRVIRDAGALHWTARDEARLAAPATFGVPGVVIPNGVDLGEYVDLPEPRAWRAAHPGHADKRLVLFIGRLNFKKGLDLLVPAFALAAASRPDLHLVIAGPDDGMRATAEALVRDTRLGARVSFPGLVRGRDKLALLRDCAMFILPSYSENFGIALVEAMACGVPVATTVHVNIWREIEAAGAGLVGQATVTDVAAQIACLADDPVRARTMGEAGKALVTHAYDWTAIAERLEAVYRALARGERLPKDVE